MVPAETRGGKTSGASDRKTGRQEKENGND